MSVIKPFKALRPPTDKAEYVACVPYDVIYDSEVRELIAENSLSFLRVTRPEGEYSESEKPSSKTVFEKAKQNLEEFIRSGVLVQDDEDAIYVYRLKDGDRSQTGVVACCSIAEYDAGLIKKHEKTRPDKVADRTEHMLTVGAQTGLIFLAFRNTDDIRDLIADAVTGDQHIILDTTTGSLYYDADGSGAGAATGVWQSVLFYPASGIHSRTEAPQTGCSFLPDRHLPF